MPTREYREIDFHKYCPKCKYLDIEDIMDPCNECLGEPCNKNSEKPIYYEPDEEVNYEEKKTNDNSRYFID